MKTKLITIAAVIIILSGVILLQLLGINLSKQELFSNCQPTNISYSGKTNYCVKIVSYNQLLSKRTSLFVIASGVERGFSIDFTPENIGNISVDWQQSTVNINDGFIELIIPSSVFTR